jgi:hypothetical protein
MTGLPLDREEIRPSQAIAAPAPAALPILARLEAPLPSLGWLRSRRYGGFCELGAGRKSFG